MAFQQPIEEDVFGHHVVDPYRWMETAHAPGLESWLRAQDYFTRQELAKVEGRQELAAAMRRRAEVLGTVDGAQIAGDQLYVLGRPPGARVQRLTRKPLEGGKEVVLLDLELLDGAPCATVHGWQPSPSGRYLAYGLVMSGSTKATLRILDTKTGAHLPESADGVLSQTLWWLPDESGFVYQRSRDVGGNTLVFHRLRSAMSADVPVFGHEVANADGIEPTDWFGIAIRKGSPFVMVSVAKAAGAPLRVYVKPRAQLLEPNTRFQQVLTDADGARDLSLVGTSVYAIADGRNGTGELVAVALSGARPSAPRPLLSLEGANLDGVWSTKEGFFLSGRRGMSRFVLETDFRGRVLGEVKSEPGHALRVLATSQDVVGGLFIEQSLLEAPTAFRYRAGRQTGVPIASMGTPLSEPSRTVSTRIVWATSSDGTKVPLTVFEPEGTAGQFLPTLMTTFGAYAWIPDSWYKVRPEAWVGSGGRHVTCHARGGGELGEAWHRGGQGDKKRNTIDDTLACADYLRRSGEARASAFAFYGWGAGGIVGSALVAEHSDLFSAIVLESPITELTRFEHTPANARSVAEFGTASTKEGFESRLAVDGYARLKPGPVYSDVLVTMRLKDAVPMPAKFVARLQSFVKPPSRVKLRVDFEDLQDTVKSSAERIASYEADVLAFVREAMASKESQLQPKCSASAP